MHRVAMKQLPLVIRRLKDDLLNAEKIARNMQTLTRFKGWANDGRVNQNQARHATGKQPTPAMECEPDQGEGEIQQNGVDVVSRDSKFQPAR
jgi:hypothetical protein